MKNLRKLGGVAALFGAGTNLLGLGVFVAFMAPKGYGSPDLNPSQIVAFLAENQAILRAWYQITFLAFGVSLFFLILALYERLKSGSPLLAQAVTTWGLIWVVMVLAIGTLSINNLSTVVALYGKDPAQAATAWLTLDSVETGLGAGGGETLVNSLWFLLLSWTALQARAFPKGLSYLGLVIGVAGLLSVVLALADLMAVFGLGIILWFIWLVIVMLRSAADPVDAKLGLILEEENRHE